MALIKERLHMSKIIEFYQSWEDSTSGVSKKAKKLNSSSPPHQGFFKFNVDGAATVKPSPTGIDGVPLDHIGKPSVVFLESIGRRESNETELLNIRRALTI